MRPDSSNHDPVAPVAVLEGIWKSYGGVAVLKDVSIDLQAGEIHALVGGNGAGKSTLMKIVTGVVSPDAGRIAIAGEEVRRLSPRAAHANGVYLVPQEPELFPNLSVLENVQLSLGRDRVPPARVRQVAEQLGASIDLDARASDLSISDQQLVELVRGILRGARLLIVDEPTSALTAREVERLFTQLRTLAADGVGIFYVSHRMPEIFALCDRVTVLRDGATCLQERTADTSIPALVAAMVPDSVAAVRPERRAAQQPDSPPALSLRELSGNGFRDITLDVFPGEVLGIAGVVGSGRTELAETVFGLRPGRGSVRLGGRGYSRRSPRRSMTRGLSYVPEDRHENGVFLLGSIVENISSTVLAAVSRAGFVDRRSDRALTDEMCRDLAIQTGSRDRHVANLSGGNQQKVSLAKALAPRPGVIMLDEPSRGIDVAARADLYRLVEKLAAEGLAVLLISSDFEEVVQLSSRVVVMRDGRLTDELVGDAITLENVRNTAFGALKGVSA
ncbi:MULTISPECIES: sugar ABC transporter ATP-binding protein [unclassified Actinotalea]|uniref:sugar ABC transporter ATP-binding protein n=1 Tax=unclassified Actinotalea TaxID=2638618 RepID=UPI0015F6B9B2|nr:MULTISPECIES: sugar ABC transporter ATP-binding protein [unclassified Actinotalea]